MLIKSFYPSQLNNIDEVYAKSIVLAWEELYRDFSYEETKTALIKIVKESKSPYIPAHGEVIEQINEARKPYRGLNPELLAERREYLAKQEAEKMERVKEWQRKLTNE